MIDISFFSVKRQDVTPRSALVVCTFHPVKDSFSRRHFFDFLPRGAGSGIQTCLNGFYSTTVWDGTYTDFGVKRRKTLYAKTARELDAKVREMARAVEKGDIVKSDGKSFLSLAARWLRCEKRTAEETTRQFYKKLIERYFQNLDRIDASEIRFINIKDVLDGLDEHPATQKKVIMMIKQILLYGVRQKVLAQSAVQEILESLPKIKHHAKEKRILTESEKEAVFEAPLSDHDKVFLLILYGCGLRREEALGLRTEDFDGNGHVTISRARALLPDGRAIDKKPKSARGLRTLPLPSSIRGQVESYAAAAGGELFPGIDRAGFDRLWRRIVSGIRAVCPDSSGLTPHIFRHSYCTDLCYQIPKISIKNVARLLGDSEQMVLNVYSHLDLLREPTDETVDEVF